MKLDAKFYGEIRKVKDDSLVPEDEYVVFLIKDDAFWAALHDYRSYCLRMGCDPVQLASLDRMLERGAKWRSLNVSRCKIPDAAGEKLAG